MSNKEKRVARKEAKHDFDKAMLAMFDLTKQILLLDEHTAALDPKTAKKVLELTDKIVRENKMTTLMITHNMKDAITYGDRLIMFHSGHIILDVSGKEKSRLKVDDLLKMFDEADEKLING
jgi:putative ABC transport system ATP-binding protein